MGHEERFPSPRPTAGSGFRKETIAGMRRNGQDAPQAAIPTGTVNRKNLEPQRLPMLRFSAAKKRRRLWASGIRPKPCTRLL